MSVGFTWLLNSHLSLSMFYCPSQYYSGTSKRDYVLMLLVFFTSPIFLISHRTLTMDTHFGMEGVFLSMMRFDF